MADGALVVFTPSGRRGRFPLGTSVLQAARELGVDIDSVCGGRALCGRCQVSLSEGEFAKLGVTSRAAHLSEVNAVEARYASRRNLAPGRRLSCQALVAGDVVIDVPAESQVHKQLVRKRADARKIALDPVVRLYYVAVAEPDMHQPASDLRRLETALEAQWSLSGLSADLHALHNLQGALRKGGWKVTVAVREDAQNIAVRPGFHDRALGLADVMPAPIAMDTKAALSPLRLGSPKLMFEAPHAVLTPSSSRSRRTMRKTAAPARLIAPIGMTSGSTTTSLAGMP